MGAAAYFNLAVQLEALDRYDEAIIAYEKSKELACEEGGKGSDAARMFGREVNTAVHRIEAVLLRKQKEKENKHHVAPNVKIGGIPLNTARARHAASGAATPRTSRSQAAATVGSKTARTVTSLQSVERPSMTTVARAPSVLVADGSSELQQPESRWASMALRSSKCRHRGPTSRNRL